MSIAYIYLSHLPIIAEFKVSSRKNKLCRVFFSVGRQIFKQVYNCGRKNADQVHNYYLNENKPYRIDRACWSRKQKNRT